MILVDSRDGPDKNHEINYRFRTFLSNVCGIPSEESHLDYGDYALEGNGPDGNILVGIERKTLRNLISSMRDGQYNEQRIGMKNTYKVSILAVEGLWIENESDGSILIGKEGGKYWYPLTLNQDSGRRVRYSEVYRYLLSVALSGVLVSHSYSLLHTAWNVAEVFKYFSKPWDQHQSLLETKLINIPSLDFHPPLVREWAARVDHIGIKRSIEAQNIFKTPIRLANAEEEEWLGISGIGTATAAKIVRQIRGFKA